MAADQHHVRMRLGHARGDRADADFGDQLHADARVAVGILQIVDQFRQILDGINVVMRRRRNQAHARRGAAHLGDPRINFFAGQFAAFAGLRALRHLDLQFLRVDQVVAGHAETPAGDLLDRGIFGIAVGFQNVARRVFAAFAGVALAADAVHGDGQRFVRFLADGAVGHRAGLETLDDALDRFDFFDRDRVFGEFEIQQAAQGAKILRLVVDQLGVFLDKSCSCRVRQAFCSLWMVCGLNR